MTSGASPTGALTLSAVIPTRNRPDDLGKAVASILGQVRPPDELLIIDQSPGDESATLIRPQFAPNGPTQLVYVHDTSITGLVDAKRAGSSRASGDIVCFLEDDVVLEPEYFREIERGFLERPDMIACSGIITNPPRTSPLYVAAHQVFFRGIFHDARVAITARALDRARGLIPCNVLSGGVSCWRRRVFDEVAFDPENGFFMLEDMEFATRVVRQFGPHLYINPLARLAHYGSPVNRDVHGTRQRRKAAEALVFYRKRERWPGAKVGLLMAMTWWLGEATLQAARLRSLGPLSGFWRGMREGRQRPILRGPRTA